MVQARTFSNVTKTFEQQSFLWTPSHSPHFRIPHAAMLLRSHVSLRDIPLKRHLFRGTLHSHCRCASGNTAQETTDYPKRIAILGGGISGLSSAHFLAKEFPKSKITIYESQKRLGGWIQGKRVDVEGGNVLFEAGPRTLRPGVPALPTALMVYILSFSSYFSNSR